MGRATAGRSDDPERLARLMDAKKRLIGVRILWGCVCECAGAQQQRALTKNVRQRFFFLAHDHNRLPLLVYAAHTG